MDLDRLAAPDLAERFTGWYTEFAADPAPPSLRHHYLAYRAFVRAKIAAIRVAQGDPEAAADVRQLAALALRHLRAGAVTLVLAGGLPGTGKSLLAGLLAGRLGWTLLSSDQIRGNWPACHHSAPPQRRSARESMHRPGPSAPTTRCRAAPRHCWNWLNR